MLPIAWPPLIWPTRRRGVVSWNCNGVCVAGTGPRSADMTAELCQLFGEGLATQ